MKTTIGIMLIGMLTLSSCQQEYADYDNGEVVENTYSGDVNVTSGGSDPAGDFEGEGDSGTYSFAWDNSEKKATVNFADDLQQNGFSFKGAVLAKTLYSVLA